MRILRTCWLLLAAWLAPLSLSGANYVFVFNNAASTAAVYDADSMVLVASPVVGVGATKAFGVPDPANQGKFLKFYVVTTSTVVVLNPDFTLKATVPFPGTLSSAPNAAALTGDAKWLVVVASSQINILNTANDAFIIPALITTAPPLGVTVTPDSKTGYVLESNSSRVDSINFTVAPPSFSGSINAPSGFVTALGMAPNGSRLYAGTNTQFIYDIDRNNNLPTTAISNPCGIPSSVNFDPDPTVATAVFNCGSVATVVNLPSRAASASSFVASGLAGVFSKILLPGANRAFFLAGAHIYQGLETAGGVPSQLLNPLTGNPFGNNAADMDINSDGSALFAAFADATPILVKINTSSFTGLATAMLSQAPTSVSAVYAPALLASFLEIYGGNNQTGLNNGQLFPSSLAVRARNGSIPVFGATVAFSTTTPSVGFTESPIATNTLGVAETLFNVPVTTPIQVTATVTSGGSVTPVVFTINPSGVVNPQGLTKISGDNQLLVQGSALLPLVVKGTPNVTVSIGTGSSPVLCPSSVVTDPTTGMASVSCSAGALPAPANAAVGYTVTMVDPSGNMVQFSVTIVPDATFLPTGISLSPNPLMGVAGQTVANALLVQQGQAANVSAPFPSMGIVFTSNQSGLVFNPASTVTAGGAAMTSITFGCAVGMGTVTATPASPNIPSASAALITVAGPVAQLIKVQGDGQSGNVGQTLNTGLVVTVADSCGNPIPAQPVTWTINPPNAATIYSRPHGTVTDNSGHNSIVLTLGSRSGPFMVTATSGTFSATFNLTVNVNPTKLLVTSGSGQTIALGTAAPQPLVAQVTDDNGNPVAGVNVTFSVTGGFATLSATQVPTDTQGHASTTVTAGATLGTITISATAIGKTVTFTISTIGRAPVVTLLGFVNGASFRQGWVPGSTGSIFGTGLGEGISGVVGASQAPFPTTLQGVSVTVGGIPAPIISMANVMGQEQINIQVPFELSAPGTTTVVISNNGSSATFTGVLLLAVMPGIFENTINGVKIAAALHADFSPVTQANPAHGGEVIQLFLTGLGGTNPQARTNVAGPSNPLAATVAQPVVGINGQGVVVIGSWYAPTLYTAYQINFVAPQGVSGLATLSVVVNGVASQDSHLPMQ